MSEQHVSLSALRDFLVSVATRNRWKPSGRLSMVILHNTGLTLHSRGYAQVHESQSVEFNVILHLGVNTAGTACTVDAFYIDGDPRLLTDGIKALRHLGKGTGINMYEVRRPADIEALFRTYDFVARLNGTTTVFNLP